MSWYVVYEISSGDLKGETGALSGLPDQSFLDTKGFSTKTFVSKPDGFLWNTATLEFDIAAPQAYQPITRAEFFDRWAVSELKSARALITSDPNIDLFFFKVGLMEGVRADNTSLLTGMTYLVTNVSVLTNARKDEILGWDVE